MRKLLLLCMTMVILSGCANVPYNYVPTSQNMDFPAKNTATTVYIGEEMLIQGEQVTAEVLTLSSPASGICYDIPAGKYMKQGEKNGKIFFSTQGNNGRVKRKGLCDPITSLWAKSNDQGKVCVMTVYGLSTCYDAPIKISKKVVPDADNIQKALLFSGKKGDEVTFIYTEKIGLQTVHTHNVTYDLKDTNIIGYRGARIEIINSSNESITYKMLENFSEK